MLNKLHSFWIAAVMVLALTGCATLTAKPDTVNKSILAVTEQAIALYNAADRLHTNGVLSDEDFSDVLDTLTEAREYIKSAKSLANAGDMLKAEDRVQLASDLLILVRNKLKEVEANE